jgi:hypothetical protein
LASADPAQATLNQSPGPGVVTVFATGSYWSPANTTASVCVIPGRFHSEDMSSAVQSGVNGPTSGDPFEGIFRYSKV